MSDQRSTALDKQTKGQTNKHAVTSPDGSPCHAGTRKGLRKYARP